MAAVATPHVLSQEDLAAMLAEAADLSLPTFAAGRCPRSWTPTSCGPGSIIS